MNNGKRTTENSPDDDLWFLDHDFLTADPVEGFQRIVDADNKIAKRTLEECHQESQLVAMSLALMYSIIKGYYQDHEDWKDQIWLRVAMELASSAWNYLSLVRHSILLGYYGEAQSLRKSWFERITRAYLMLGSQDEQLADRWLQGNLANQTEVNTLIKSKMQDDNSGAAMYESLKAKWRYLNEHSHPDVESLLWRTLYANTQLFETDRRAALIEVVGDNPVLGGLAGRDRQKAALLRLTEDIIFSCSTLVLIATNRDEWGAEIERFEQRRNELLAEIDGSSGANDSQTDEVNSPD